MSKKRIGILTSGGDCPGLNAVIRGAVKASHQLGYDCVGFLKGYEGLYDPVQYVHLTPETTRGILNQGGTILGSTNKGRFAATVGVQDRQELDPTLVEGVKQTIEQLGITGLICVGGDGSLAVAQQFHENGIPVVGVPKTIDNDLSATAFTFGFDSAIECATDALDRLHTTAASHERIMVLEVMGRHAGWIALHAGIAGGGDVILIPEIEWNWDDVCHKILHRDSNGKKFTLVVVAEGAELPGGGLVGEQRAGQQMKLGGVGAAVATEIERRLHRETRLSVLGHLQRGGKPTTFDRVLATQFGAHAVRLVQEERFGEMICSTPPTMQSVPIIEAVNELRGVDPHGPAVQAARALGISFGDRPADEVGQNVFNRQDALPKAHVAEYVEHHPEELAEHESLEATPVATAPVVAEEDSTPEVTADAQPTQADEAIASPDTPAVEQAEHAAVSETSEPEASVEVVEVDDPEPAGTVDEIDAVTVAEAASDDEPGVETQADSTEPAPVATAELLEPDAADADSVEETVAEAAAEVTEPEPVVATPTEAVAAETEPAPAVAVAEADDEPEELFGAEEADEEEVADAVLDMVADVDEAIHGSDAEGDAPAAEPEKVEEEPVIEKPETDLLTDGVEEMADEVTESESAAAEPAATPTFEESGADAALEVDEQADDGPQAKAPPKIDLNAVQSQLANRIAEAAKANRDSAPAEVSVESIELDEIAAEADSDAADAAEPAAHDEDLVAEARSALEAALTD